MYLLDTNIVSELRRPRPHGGVLAWIGSVDNADLHLSAVTLGEIQAGIERTRAIDPRKAREIEAWADRAIDSFQILDMTVPIFRYWARLMHGRSNDAYEDAMIAATAHVHRLQVVTRNIRHFVDFDVPVFNPFDFGREDDKR